MTLARVSGAEPLRRVLRRARRLLNPGSLILIYHRVAEPAVDPFGLAVSPGHFAEQMEVLRSKARPTPLARVLHALRDGGPLRRRVVVTFDDGYADNLDAALPILEGAGVPATVFVASGFIGGGAYWWDDLGRGLLSPGTLPARLDLDLGGCDRATEDTSEAACFTADDARRHARWRFTNDEPATPRHLLYKRLYLRLQRLPGDGPRRAVAALLGWAGLPASKPDDEARALTEEELSTLAGSPLIEIGAHTWNHPALPDLPVGEQAEEIESGKRWLEARLGRPVTSFSYPYGKFDGATVEALVGAGLKCGLGASGGSFRRGVSPFALPRGWVEDWDGDEFGRRLYAWLSA